VRNKRELRSFEQDLAAIKASRRAAKRAAALEVKQAAAMFDALSREIDEQNRLAAQYGGANAAVLAATPQLDLARTLPRAGSLASSPSQDSLRSGTTATTATRGGGGEDAEVAEEAFKGFRRNKDNAKAELTMDNEAYLEARRTAQARSAATQFVRANIREVAKASAEVAAGKSPADYPRYLRPEELGVREFHVYGGQQMNVWQLQKDLMRQQMQEAEARSGIHKHYTYSEEYLSASFEKFSMDDANRAAKEADLAARITAEGFRWPAHKTHAESMHPSKDLHPSTIEALQHPPDVGVTNLARLLDTKAHGQDGEAALRHPHDFAAYPAPNREFGMPDNPEWGKSLGISCDAMQAIEQELRQAAKDEWRRKVRVKDTAFHVLWSGSGQVGTTNAIPGRSAAQMERILRAQAATAAPGSPPLPILPAAIASRPDITHINLLKDAPARPGLQFTRVRRDADTGKIVERRHFPVPDCPVSMHALSPFVDQNRTIHMRTLEQKEAAELDDTPRSPRPPFAVTQPLAPQSFIHKRKIPKGPRRVPTTPRERPATAGPSSTAAGAASSAAPVAVPLAASS